MEHEATEPSAFVVSKGRLEMLFDGIFAIAMTILVLELRVPELADRHSVAELARALGHHASTFASYLLSFLMLGILWYRHNQHYRHLQHVTAPMLAFHLVQLAMAAFFPFCAALMGRYPTNRLLAVFYTGCIMTYFWCALLEWMVAKRCGAISPGLDAVALRRERRRTVSSALVTTALFVSTLAMALAG
ncbi:MAG TPA: TMEM175 family protein [Thermoanaerobaculaceae bacterium]|nr:TMEM175 family protein [Thermoanaerobaculaceae bacterium]